MKWAMFFVFKVSKLSWFLVSIFQFFHFLRQSLSILLKHVFKHYFASAALVKYRSREILLQQFYYISKHYTLCIRSCYLKLIVWPISFAIIRQNLCRILQQDLHKMWHNSPCFTGFAGLYCFIPMRHRYRYRVSSTLTNYNVLHIFAFHMFTFSKKLSECSIFIAFPSLRCQFPAIKFNRLWQKFESVFWYGCSKKYYV